MAAAPKTTARPKASLPVNYAAQLAEEAAKIAERVAAPSGDRIKAKGNTDFITPDGMEGNTIDCVVIEFVSANMYYDGVYDRDNPAPAACFAINSEPKHLAPSPKSPNIQADSCAACPQNAFGTANNGKGKACKNTRLLAIIPTSVLDKPDETAPIWILSVPPTSMKTFDAYVTGLAAKYKTVPVGVVTRISLDPKSTFFSPRFDVVRPLQPDEIGVFMPYREAAVTRLHQEPDVTNYVAPKPVGRGVPARAPRR